MFWRAKRVIFRTRIYSRRRTFESLALKMCHFLLDVHGRAQIIASLLHLSICSNFVIVVAVIRIELIFLDCGAKDKLLTLKTNLCFFLICFTNKHFVLGRGST